MYFSLPYKNYFRNNFTYTQSFIFGYVWDLLVIQALILALLLFIFGAKKFIQHTKYGSALKDCFVDKNIDQDRHIQRASLISADNTVSDKYRQQSFSQKQQQAQKNQESQSESINQEQNQKNPLNISLKSNNKTQNRIKKAKQIGKFILNFISDFMFVLIWIDMACIVVIFSAFGYMGYGVWSELMCIVITEILVLFPCYMRWHKYYLKSIYCQSLIKQSQNQQQQQQQQLQTDDTALNLKPFQRIVKFCSKNKSKLLFLLVLLASTLLSSLAIQLTKGACASGYNEKFGLDAGEQFFVSSSFSRWINSQQDKLCPDDKVCRIYATLPEVTDTAVFINVHTGVGLDRLQVELVKDQVTGKAKGSFSSIIQQSLKPYRMTNVEQLGQRLVHSVLFTDLQPYTVYSVKVYSIQDVSINNDKNKIPLNSIIYSKILVNETKYRTVHSSFTQAAEPNQPQQQPQQPKQFRIVMGGDIGMTSKAQQIISHLPEFDPDVIIIGGDTSYDDAQRYCYMCWDNFFDMFDKLNQQMGMLIPLVLSVGNHDVGFEPLTNQTIQYGQDTIPLFLLYFPQHFSKDWVELTPENNNYTVPGLQERSVIHHHFLGPALVMNLDSGYLNSFQSQVKQIRFLSEHYPKYYKFVNFHNPIYPSCIDLTDKERNDYYVYTNSTFYWVPLFDFYNFTAVFEHHTHHMKITHKLKNNTITISSQEGTRYVGDGSWGVKEPSCTGGYDDNFKHFFQEYDVSAYSDHVWLVTIKELQNKKTQNSVQAQNASNSNNFVINYTAMGICGNKRIEQIDKLNQFSNKTNQRVLF